MEPAGDVEEQAPAPGARCGCSRVNHCGPVGQKAPDFTAMAYVGGEFGRVSLADYRGKWVMLASTRATFTFV